jgi:acyl carrier protein|tara:strand:+ start:2461 stop:2718 length:258 start_codon:yes stop_codon:yes gene_type:complete
MDIRSKVIEIIADQAIVEPSDLTDESTLESLGIDSLGLVESIFAIEEAFNIQIPFNANQPNESPLDLSSVATIVQGIEQLIQEQA